VAVISALAMSLLCALLDTLHLLDPRPPPPGTPPLDEWLPIYGQETLPIAILGLGFLVVASGKWWQRGAALAGMLFACWREGARSTQSVVLMGIGGALVLLLVHGLILALHGKRDSLKRAALCSALFAVLVLIAAGYRYIKRSQSTPEAPGAETADEVKSWNMSRYAALFDLYNRTQPPADPAARMIANRPLYLPGQQPLYLPVDDPEVYKLQAVFDSEPCRSKSVRNNIWRFLVWRRMFSDWREDRAIVGAGVGKPWFYRALYQSKFHYGDDREGLDPHNSYLNMLYRYGVVGLALLVIAIGATFVCAHRALARAQGDVLLEALLLYFGYTLIFAFFTVSLFCSSYSRPF